VSRGAGVRRRIALVALLTLVPLLIVEASVRGLIATHHLPVAAAHLPDFAISWTNLQRQGAVDILILGDSVAQQGILPAGVREALAPALGHDVAVFNAASASGTLGVNLAVARQLASEGRLPRVVMIGIQPGILRDDNTLAVFAGTPMGMLFTACTAADGMEASLDCRLGQVSALWRWRGHFDIVWAGIGREMDGSSTSGGLTLRQDGFRAGRGLSDEKLLGQLAIYLERPAPFNLGAEARDQFVTLVRFLRHRGSAVVAVAVPEAPQLTQAREERQPGWTVAWHAALDELSRRAGIPIVDPGPFGSWYGEGSMRNIKHLSERGAAGFTHQLMTIPEVRDPMVQALRGP